MNKIDTLLAQLVDSKIELTDAIKKLLKNRENLKLNLVEANTILTAENNEENQALVDEIEADLNGVEDKLETILVELIGIPPVNAEDPPMPIAQNNKTAKIVLGVLGVLGAATITVLSFGYLNKK